MAIIEYLRSEIAVLPILAKFAIGVAIIAIVPPLSRRARLPAVVGLLLSGVLFGPHVLDVFRDQRPVASFLGDLGALLLMFFAGLEIDLKQFRQQALRSFAFGLATTTIPLLLGTVAALWLGYGPVAAIVVGSLLASHTLLGLPIIRKLGMGRIEPIAVTIGATVMSDTLSLIVFALCVPLYRSGFSPSALAVQIIEIMVFIPLVLFGLSRVAARVLKRMENDEETYFILLLGILAAAAALAQLINLPGIVGTFLAGLAVNAAVHDKPAKTKLEFLGNSFFIPIFFVTTGFLIDPLVLARSVIRDFPAVAAVVGHSLAANGSPRNSPVAYSDIRTTRVARSGQVAFEHPDRRLLQCGDTAIRSELADPGAGPGHVPEMKAAKPIPAYLRAEGFAGRRHPRLASSGSAGRLVA